MESCKMVIERAHNHFNPLDPHSRCDQPSPAKKQKTLVKSPPASTQRDPTQRFLIVPCNRLEERMAPYVNWYSWLAKFLAKELPNTRAEVCDMPDPFLGREVFWVPHLADDLKVDGGCVVVGHGIGGSAALRLAERTRLRGLVLVDALIKHNDDVYAKATYNFDREWDWAAIAANCDWIMAFGSKTSPPAAAESMPFPDWSQQEDLATQLGITLTEITSHTHTSSIQTLGDRLLEASGAHGRENSGSTLTDIS